MNQQTLSRRLQEVDNPDWWLELYALAAETSGDWDSALAVADEAYHDMPEPPTGPGSEPAPGTDPIIDPRDDATHHARRGGPLLYQASDNPKLLAAIMGGRAMGDYLVLPVDTDSSAGGTCKGTSGSRRIRVVTLAGDDSNTIELPDEVEGAIVVDDRPCAADDIYWHPGSGTFHLDEATPVDDPEHLRAVVMRHEPRTTHDRQDVEEIEQLMRDARGARRDYQRRGRHARHYAAERAPAGGVTIAGTEYRGGEWIPAEVMAGATAAERQSVREGGGKPAVAGAGGAGSGSNKKPAATQPDSGENTHRQRINSVLGGLIDKSANLSPEHRAAYKQATEAVTAKMPKEALHRFQRHLKGANYHTSTQDLTASMVQSDPELANRLGPGETVAGAYTLTTRTLELDGPAKQEGVRTKDSVPHIYAHEFSHVIDGPDFEISNSPEWQHAWQTEMAGNRLTQYASTHSAEGFAEFGRLLYASGEGLDRVRAIFPACVKVWEQRGLV